MIIFIKTFKLVACSSV